jgi:transcription-repair coupling factor (superfamily II helicase)
VIKIDSITIFAAKIKVLSTKHSFFSTQQVDQLIEKINHQQHLLLKGLAGSSKAVLTASVAQESKFFHLVVCADKESAAYCYNDLENLLDEREKALNKKTVLFYPTSYKRPYEPEKADNNYILSRSDVLRRVSTTNRKTIAVTYPEALSEKVFTQKLLNQNSFRIKTAEAVSLDFLTDFLAEFHFERVDFVIEPGQFALRGGIVDVFSFADEHPFRIEFFGDEVESIRSFDPVSQRSLHKLDKVVLLPNMHERMLVEERESLLKHLPQNLLVWIDESQALAERIDMVWEKALEANEKIQHENKQYTPLQTFSQSHDIISQLAEIKTIEWGNSGIMTSEPDYHFHTLPQPVFNKNFDLFLAHLKEKKTTGFQVYIFSESSRQLERLQSILSDLQHDTPEDEQANFVPVYHSLCAGYINQTEKVCLFTDHQIFERYHRFRLRDAFAAKEAITIKELNELKPGDFVTHIDHGIGRFDGLEMIDNNGKRQEAVRLIYQNSDLLYVSIHSLHRIAKYSGKDGAEPTLSKLGSNAWNKLKNKAKTRVKDIARELIKLYAERRNSPGFQFMPDTYLQAELEASFIYEDTPDQLKATVDVKKDMESEAPMDRLVCGDVGFGKTEIAIRAAFKAVTDSKQVAILVPTTILALQHFKTFKDRLNGFPVEIDYLNRFKSAKQQNETLEKLKKGTIDILIGTHRLISKDVIFKDLGLLIIDEEQKFGVAAKEKLKQIKANVDTLTLTATPIPRTLQFSMMGARDLSIINTPPPNRYPVQTEIRSFNETLIRDAIQYELSRDGQVFFVHNRVQNIMDVHDMIIKFVPGIRVAIAHGQMDGHRLEKTMLGFINGDYDVLLATTIIESGLDISNANTIIINEAHHYGLSDLHQLRGRVGRSNKKAFCYLLAPPMAALTSEAQKRLRALEEFADLGSGFNIALRDLDIRGAGNLLGGEQSGFINDIGFETFHKILDEAILELKETEFKDLFTTDTPKQFVRECVFESDLEILIPGNYVSTSAERIRLYSELDNLADEESLESFAEVLIDRFGPIPKQTNSLFNTIRLRWIARNLGFEKLVLKNKMLTAYFVSDQQSAYYQSAGFSAMLRFVQANPELCRMKETNGKLLLHIKSIDSVQKALELMREIEAGLK